MHRRASFLMLRQMQHGSPRLKRLEETLIGFWLFFDRNHPQSILKKEVHQSLVKALPFFTAPSAQEPTGRAGRIFSIAVFATHDLYILGWEREAIQKNRDLALEVAGGLFRTKAGKDKGSKT